MRKILITILICLLVTGCYGRKHEASPAETVWTRDDRPVSVAYSRMWAYSAAAQSEDPVLLDDLVTALKALEIMNRSSLVTEDYTDILTFTFADGDTLRLEFENSCWVNEAGERWEVKGLDKVRAILDGLIEE